jgi:pyruvate formate lyase activating enzyme
MILKGLQKLTLLDFPGKIGATVFTGGCNLRCPFCHNASLVIPEKFGETLPEEELFSFLKKRRGMLEGVTVSGGEPTLYPDLVEFITRIRELGYLVKLDTNGTNPKMLSHLIEGGLLDYVAMDIKSSRGGYPCAVGIESFGLDKIEKSIEILRKSKVNFEFRTTIVKELHTKEDVEEIGKWLSGDEKFFLQTFRDSGDLIGSGYSAYSEEEMQSLLEIIKNYLPNAELR